MRFHLTMCSSNRKTGPMPVATSSKDTCPVHCPLREKVCYARYGPIGFFWEAVSLGVYGDDLRGFLGKIRKIPEGTLWRYGQAGDLPGDGRKIDRQALKRIVTFQQGRRGYSLHALPLSSTALVLGSDGRLPDIASTTWMRSGKRTGTASPST
jgi:hypothetical protein